MAYSPPSNAEPFSLHISDAAYSKFRLLLEASCLGPLTYDNGFDDGRYGISYRWLSQAKDHWENNFDWRAQERHINSFPNYKMHVEDEKGPVDMHFVGLWSQRRDVKPLVLLHGWPSSFLEFLPALEILSARYGKDLPFHVIVPSLPGYTLSSGPATGVEWKATDAARIVHAMMINLGFSQYVVQGGDVGSWIAALLATTYDEVIGLHLNLLVTLDSVDPEDPELNALEKKVVKRVGERFVAPTTGAAIMNSTRPATIGVMLHSNPLSLLAWMAEKFREWPEEPFSLDDILTSTTLWWFTETAARSVYTYRSTFACSDFKMDDPYFEKPFGYSWFMHELIPAPAKYVQPKGNLVFYRQHEKGGHFAAKEQPVQFVQDMEAFVEVVLSSLKHKTKRSV